MGLHAMALQFARLVDGAADDWAIDAHTVEGQLSQRFLPWLVGTVGYRHHIQTGTSYFTTRAPLDVTYRTADSDLDRLTSDSWIGRVTIDVPLRPPGPKALHVDFGYEAYSRSNDLSATVMTCSTGFSF